MNCISIYGRNIVSGIGAINLPFPQIEVVRRNGKSVYVPIDPSIVRDWQEVCSLCGIVAKTGRVYDAYPVKIHNSNNYKLIPVPKNVDNDGSVIVYWELPSGRKGSAQINPARYEKQSGNIFLRDKRYHFAAREKVAETAICVSVLSPNQHIEGEITGGGISSRKKMLYNDGEGVLVLDIY